MAWIGLRKIEPNSNRTPELNSGAWVLNKNARALAGHLTSSRGRHAPTGRRLDGTGLGYMS